ncbi:MAG TPA: FtsX-like permease family protein [Gemmatimonadaceae bacterium]
MSYDVTRRSKEIGIRTALGATAGDAVMLVLRDAATMSAIGLVLGVLPALALGRAFAAQLYGIEPMDPRVVVGAMAVLAIAALVASLGPGIRAARVDPLVAIRTD